jgi:hypothetical protein
MYVALILLDLAGVLGATLVQKIFYTASACRLPVPLPLRSGHVQPAAGSSRHRLLVLLIIGAIVLVYLVVKKFWSKGEAWTTRNRARDPLQQARLRLKVLLRRSARGLQSCRDWPSSPPTTSP